MALPQLDERQEIVYKTLLELPRSSEKTDWFNSLTEGSPMTAASKALSAAGYGSSPSSTRSVLQELERLGLYLRKGNGRGSSFWVKVTDDEQSFALVAEASAISTAREKKSAGQAKLDKVLQEDVDGITSAVAALADIPKKYEAAVLLSSRLMAENQTLQRENDALKQQASELQETVGDLEAKLHAQIADLNALEGSMRGWLEQHLKENITDASQRAIRAAVNALKDEKKLVPVRGRNPSLVKLPQRDLPFAQVAEASAAAAAKEQQASSQTRLDVASESFLNEVISAVAVLAEYPDKLKALLRLDSQLLADNEALQRENEVLKAENEELRPYKGLYETLAAVFEGQRNSET